VLGWITSAQHVRLRSMWEASTSVSDVITGPTLNHYGCGPTGGEAASSQEIWAFEHAFAKAHPGHEPAGRLHES
jgi:hypothetical protein